MDSSSSLTLAVISGPMALASMLMQVNTEGSTTHDRVFLNTTHTHTHTVSNIRPTHYQQHQVNTKGSAIHDGVFLNTCTVSNIR